MMPVLRFFLSPFQKLMRPMPSVRIFEVDDIQFVRPGERGGQKKRPKRGSSLTTAS